MRSWRRKIDMERAAEHQTSNLGVGGSNPSERAKYPLKYRDLRPQARKLP
jgi:hypothetical protein